jgi:hypothetical protein
MTELIDIKNYEAAENTWRLADKLMVDLIEEAHGYVVRPDQ